MINSKVAPWCTRPLLLGVAALLVACNEGGGNDAGAAREGFRFDPALVGADGKGIGASRLDEIGVGAGRGE